MSLAEENSQENSLECKEDQEYVEFPPEWNPFAEYNPENNWEQPKCYKSITVQKMLSFLCAISCETSPWYEIPRDMLLPIFHHLLNLEFSVTYGGNMNKVFADENYALAIYAEKHGLAQLNFVQDLQIKLYNLRINRKLPENGMMAVTVFDEIMGNYRDQDDISDCRNENQDGYGGGYQDGYGGYDDGYGQNDDYY